MNKKANKEAPNKIAASRKSTEPKVRRVEQVSDLTSAASPKATKEGFATGNIAFQGEQDSDVATSLQSIISSQQTIDFVPVNVVRSNAIQELLYSLTDLMTHNDNMITDLAQNLSDVMSTFADVGDSPTYEIPTNSSPMYESIVRLMEQANRQTALLAAITSNLEI